MQRAIDIKTCFISAPAKTDLLPLRGILEKIGIKAVLPFELPIRGRDFGQIIEDAIRDADLCIGIFPQKADLSNVYFEVGYAAGKRKPILLIIPDGEFNPPASLVTYPVCTAPLTDEARIEAFLESYLQYASRRKSMRREISQSRALGKRASLLLDHLHSLGTHATEAEIHNILADAFEAAGVSAVAEPSGDNRRYDFGLWIDELDSLIGNPIMVEFKRNLDRPGALRLKSHFIRDFGPGGRGLLVVYLRSTDADVSKLSSGVPLVLFLSISELIAELRNRSLSEFIRKHRNRLVHGNNG
jgi:hypothetical protein